MKPDSIKHLQSLAASNLKNGESRAIEIASRAQSLTGSPAALEIVRSVYSGYDRFSLARLASANCWNGGASALVTAKAIEALTGDGEAVDIVSRVYSRADGRAIFECRECGFEHLDPDSAAGCCGPESWEDSAELETCHAWN
jgi:hypothetical protein